MIRLFLDKNIDLGSFIELESSDSHYLYNVMRKKGGDYILIFNGVNGEWLAEIDATFSKNNVRLIVVKKNRDQEENNSKKINLCFAPVKGNAFDNILRQSVELGVSRIIPIITARTERVNINIDRIKRIIKESAEQSERLTLPVFDSFFKFDQIRAWENVLICDETGGGSPPKEVMQMLGKSNEFFLLIGPEGGFTDNELSENKFIKMSLGTNILRADTAAIAAISCVKYIV